MKKYKVTLTEEERLELQEIVSKGTHRSQKVLNALILLNCDEGESQKDGSINEVISTVLQVSMKKIDRVKKRFSEEGLDVALHGHKGEEFMPGRRMGILKHTWLRSAAVHRLKDMRGGRYGCWQTALLN